jgi:hypothetical protein
MKSEEFDRFDRPDGGRSVCSLNGLRRGVFYACPSSHRTAVSKSVTVAQPQRLRRLLA